MKTASQIQDIKNRLESASISLVAQEFLRTEAIGKIAGNQRLSESAKAEELAKVNGLEVLRALRAQVKILSADLDSGAKDWSNLGQVLRNAALPNGGTPAEASVFGMLRDEALALEADPRALQLAMETASLGKNWSRLYALTLGRCDENGMPLRDWKGVIAGIRLDCCDFPGQLSVMEALAKGQEAALKAEVAWAHATGQTSATASAMLANEPGKLSKAKFDREARMLMTPAEALKRAEDERTDTRDRYEHIPDDGGLFVIFDRATGQSRFVDQKTGPAYLARLNDLTRVPRVADELPLVSPITADPGTVPGV